jgi:spore coat protein U-like protein
MIVTKFHNISFRSHSVKYTHVKSAMVAVAALTLALVSVPNSAFAAPGTATIAVSASVVNTCTLNNGTLAFGTYSGAKVSVTGTFTVNCTNGGDYIIALDKGNGSGATFAQRLMTNQSNTAYTLGYSIFTASGGTTVWGDGTSSTATVTGIGTGTSQTINVYGVIPASETVLTGTYNDTITATVTY